MQVRVNATHAVYGTAGSIVELDDDDSEALALIQRGILTRLHEQERSSP